MRIKKGISLVSLVITIIVMIMIAGVAVLQVDDVFDDVEKSDFVLELSTIEDKIKEYYLLVGSLPVKDSIDYTATELKEQLTEVDEQAVLESEIIENGDTNNTFFIVDLKALELETNDRGKAKDSTDIYVVASNTLNVYYLKGELIYDIIRFSLVTLVEQNEVEGEAEVQDTEVVLNTQLSVLKNTNTWTNEIDITVKNELQDDEQLQYSIGGDSAKTITGNVIVINSDNMTATEKTAFSTSKQVTISRLKNGSLKDRITVNIANLDITKPSLGTMSMTNTSNTNNNVVTINTSDNGESGVKKICYDYVDMLQNNTLQPYYSNRSQVTVNELINFGKATYDGTIILDKNIKSIVAVAVDVAGNVSDITTYTIEDMYLVSK